MVIIDTNLKFGSLSKRNSTNRIILHHAEASTATPEQIHAWHLGNGWAGAGYHFYVRKDGNVYALRPEWAVGSHAQGANSDSIGICFEGNYMNETMPDAQIRAGQELVAYLKDKYGIDKVQRHREVTSTDCPGVRFPFDEIAYASTTKEDELINVAIQAGTYPVYRAYNTKSGAHIFTADKAEYDSLGDKWTKEDIAWYAPDTGSVVYRMHDPNSGQYMFTVSYDEAAALQAAGWKAEGINFASGRDGKPVYRFYNPNTGDHMFTANPEERDMLKAAEWVDEGVAFYAV